jgi:hypothetical protein
MRLPGKDSARAGRREHDPGNATACPTYAQDAVDYGPASFQLGTQFM